MLNLSLVGILFCSFFVPGDCSYYDYYYSQYSGPGSYGSYLFPAGALQKKGPEQTTEPEYSTEGLAPWADPLTGPCANLRCSCLEHLSGAPDESRQYYIIGATITGGGT